jgi:hypothetical protein
LGYSDPTLKKLFALSGNNCAFPGCPAPIVDGDSGIIVGEICHIKGKSPNGPRYDKTQSNDERNGYDNLLLMCDPHNKIVDHEDTRDDYPPERLQKFKNDHETQYRRTLTGRFLTDEDIAALYSWESDGRPLIQDELDYPPILQDELDYRLMNKFVNHFHDVQGSIITTHNQSGGQTAHQITNIHPPPQAQPPVIPSIVPVIESYRTSTDHHGIDYYCFRVNLRNDGKKTIREFRLEVAIPNAYANSTHLNSMSACRVRGDVTVYTHTDKHFRDFVLFPKDTSDPVMNTDYQMRLDQYKDASGIITVSVYSDDDLVGSEDYSIRDHRNKDRMRHLGLLDEP